MTQLELRRQLAEMHSELTKVKTKTNTDLEVGFTLFYQLFFIEKKGKKVCNTLFKVLNKIK